MKKDLSLTKLTSIYILGNLTSKIINFGLFFLYTFFLNMSELGFFDLVITTVTLITPVINLQVYDAVLRWLVNEDEKVNIDKVVSSSICILLFNLAIFTILYSIVWYFTNFKFGLLIYILLVFQSCYLLIPQIIRGIGKNSIYALNGVIFSFVFLITASIFLGVLKWKIEGLLISNIIAILISTSFVFYKAEVYKYLDFKYFSKKTSLDLIKYSMPLIPNTLSWWVISTSNRYLILYFWGTALNGLFAIAFKLPSILLLLSGIFSMAWVEKSMKTYQSADRDDYYTSIFEKYFSLLFCSIIVLISLSKPLLKLIVQSSYFEVWKLLPFLYLAVGFQSLSSFYATGYFNSKRTKEALYTTIHGAGTTILASFILIPYAKLVGASISILLGYVVMFLLRVRNTKEFFTIKLPLTKMIYIHIILIIISLITISDNIFLLVLNIVIALVVFVIYNKPLLIEYIKKMVSNKQWLILEGFHLKFINVISKFRFKYER